MNLKKLERYWWVNLLGPDPRLMTKILLGRGLTKVEKHWVRVSGVPLRLMWNISWPLPWHLCELRCDCFNFFPSHGATAPPPVNQGFLLIEDSRSHSSRHTILGRTPLDEWSARRVDIYLKTHKTHSRQICPLRYSNPQYSKRAAANPGLIPHGNWDRCDSFNLLKPKTHFMYQQL